VRRWWYAIILGLLLGIAVPASLTPEAYAQAGLDRIEQKVQDLQDLVSKVLVVVVVIGAMFVGFRFIQGDPHTWKYAMMFVLGATIIFSAQALMQWLKA
jgi:type IV secretory pathway VirB2 component (pilin)